MKVRANQLIRFRFGLCNAKPANPTSTPVSAAVTPSSTKSSESSTGPRLFKRVTTISEKEMNFINSGGSFM